MRYKYILFDLDGTLTDPKVGITKSVQCALKHYGITEDNLDNLEKFIGPPLKESFMEFYSLGEPEALEAISVFRRYFKEKGIYENNRYPGINELLKKLNENGCTLALSTSKPEVFAIKILEHFNLTDHFKVIVGSNLDGSRTDKGEVITHTLKLLGNPEKNSVLMVGDRKHDILGAKKNYVDSLGVTYGYGGRQELEESSASYIVDKVEDLLNIVMG